jgi:hypothetical protein
MLGRRLSTAAALALAVIGGALFAQPVSADPFGPIWNRPSGHWQHRPSHGWYGPRHHSWHRAPGFYFGYRAVPRCWTEVRTVRVKTRHHGWVWRDRLVRYCR